MQNAGWHSGNALGCLNMKQRPPQRQRGSGVGQRGVVERENQRIKREADRKLNPLRSARMFCIAFPHSTPFAHATVQQPK